MKPHHLALGLGTLGGILLFVLFPIYPNLYQQAATASAATVPAVLFTQSTFQTKEGTSAVIRVKLDAPADRTTRVCVRFTPDQGTTSRDFVNPGCAAVTFYQGGLTQKSILLKTVNTATVANESVTARIDTVNGVRVSSPTARVLITDKTGNSNTTDPYTTTATTTTTLPPTNCAQYAGVLPNNNRNVNVVQKSFPRVVYNSGYALSTEGKKDLDLMQGDIGYQLTFGVKGPGNWNTVTIPSGTAYAYRFKTTEYNYPVYYRLSLGDRPATTGGVVVTSISLCPGDFTSPAVMEQTTGHDEYNTGNTVGDQKFRNCVTYGRPLNSGGGIEFGIGGNTQYICALQPNKTYYLNVSAGFAGGGDKGPTTPHIGTFDGTTAGTEMTADFTMYPFGHLQAVGNIGNKVWNTDIIKNRTAFYTEARRISGLFMAASQRRVAACQAAIMANTGPRTGRECNNLAYPTPEYTFQE